MNFIQGGFAEMSYFERMNLVSAVFRVKKVITSHFRSFRVKNHLGQFSAVFGISVKFFSQPVTFTDIPSGFRLLTIFSSRTIHTV